MQKVLTLLGYNFSRYNFNRYSFSRYSGRRPAVMARREPWKLWLAYGLVVANIALALASIISVNYYTASGYKLSQLQTQVDKLNDQNKKLMVKTTELGSVVALQENLAAAGYVAAGTPQFVKSAQLSQR